MNRLAQHFLKNNSAIKEIIDALDLGSGDRVIEIGAGHGELTEKILVPGSKLKVTAVEKDPELAGSLKEKFGGDARIEILEGDALKILPGLTNPSKSKKYKLVGNIPYYITGKLLRILSELKNKPVVSVLTIQKEVAERIVAMPRKMNPVRSRDRSEGKNERYQSNERSLPQDESADTHRSRSASNGMNRLAAIVRFWAEPKIVRIIPRKDFYPEPEVDSAIIKLGVRCQVSGVRNRKLKVSELDYYATVKTLFAQPRKTILNNLLSKNAAGSGKNRGAVAELLKKMKIDPTDRPQNLNIEDIERISSVFWGT